MYWLNREPNWQLIRSATAESSPNENGAYRFGFDDDPRQAYSHSASEGKRKTPCPKAFKAVVNDWQSLQET
jgi:hypothetical protein